MRCLLLLTTCVALAATMVLGQSTHRVCAEYTRNGDSIFYDITTNLYMTNIKRYNMSADPPTLMDSNDYAPLLPPYPEGTNWIVGVGFAALMQLRNSWASLPDAQTLAAYWDVLGEGLDQWRFEMSLNSTLVNVTFSTKKCDGFNGVSPTSVPLVPPPPTVAPNCLSLGSANGVHCTSEQSCCGEGTNAPQCIDKASNHQCCVHMTAATTCNSTQSCCGSFGPGTSQFGFDFSVAFCCDEGSTCCQATQPESSLSAACCPAGSKCCRGAMAGFCCASNEECDANTHTCRAV